MNNKNVNGNVCNKRIRQTKGKYSYEENPLPSMFCLKYVFRNEKYVFLETGYLRPKWVFAAK